MPENANAQFTALLGIVLSLVKVLEKSGHLQRDELIKEVTALKTALKKEGDTTDIVAELSAFLAEITPRFSDPTDPRLRFHVIDGGGTPPDKPEQSDP